jgi:hypothetical protein
MRNHFDHLVKQVGQKALGPSGTTFVQDPISPEVQHADIRHEPDPTRQAERDRLGLLGRLAAYFCIIEVYSDAPNAEEFRSCLMKHLTSWQERSRKARSDNKKRSELGQPPEVFVDSFLWIIAAGVPKALLTELELKPARDWPSGVYLFGAGVLRVGIVVASELPCDRATLLIRLMAAGPLLAPAVKELAALPPDAHERAVAEPALLHLQYVLGQNPSRDPYEQEFIMVMYKSWEEARDEAHTKGHTEGRTEGRVETQANAVLTVLRVRGIAVSDTARQRILAQKDLAQLERWLEKASVASSLGEVLDDPS